MRSRKFFSESGIEIPGGIWRTFCRMKEALTGTAAAPLTRRVNVYNSEGELVRTRLVSDFGARDASPNIARVSDADVPIDSFKSDLERKKSLHQVMGPARKKTGLIDDVFGMITDCPDSVKDGEGRCPDDPDYEGAVEEGERDPRRALKSLGMKTEPTEAEREFNREMSGVEKETKEDVNYRYSPDPVKTCGKCRFFQEPGSCKIVEGLIRTIDVCDLFRPSYAKAARQTFNDEMKK